MKIAIILFLISFSAFGQIRNVPPTSMNPVFVLPDESYVNAKVENQARIDSTKAAQIPAERKFAIIEIFDNDAFIDSFKVKKLVTNVVTIEREGQITKMDTNTDTATLYLSGYSDKVFVATMTWHTNQTYDTTWTETARIDDAGTNTTDWQTLTNVWKVANTTKPGVYKNSFMSVSVTSSPSVMEMKPVVCDRLEFFGERFSGHGNVKVFVDGPDGAWMQVATLYQGANPWVTDFSRMQPSFFYTFPKEKFDSPARPHKIKFETVPGNQFIVDFIRVVKMTLSPHVIGPVTPTPQRKR